jgi:hypothetical protein
MDVATGIAAVTGGIEAVKGLLAVKQLSDSAEIKLRLSEVIDSLLSAKVSLYEAQDALRAKDLEVGQLREALQMRERVTLRHSAYYATDADGNPHGHPYCMKCWEGANRLHHLALPSNYQKPSACNHCKSNYDFYTTPLID